jgi:hypothetical protein
VKPSLVHDFFRIQKHRHDSNGLVQECDQFQCVQKMCEQIKEYLVLSNAREFFLLYVQGLILAQSFHLNLSIFLLETCDLQKYFLLGVV